VSKQKPDLTLLPGKLALDAESLADFFTKLTGKTPSEKEMQEVRRYLAEHTPPRNSDADDVP
jgi:hypothetical protein